jgi:antitoxin component of MazEF toxin-antitoxin module
MADVIIDGKILAWGNSYGIRIKKGDLEREGLQPGEQVVVRIERRGERIDLSDLPVFAGGRSDVSARHDEYLARGLEEEMGLDDGDGDGDA